MFDPAVVALIISSTVLITVLLLLVVTILYDAWPRLKTWVHYVIGAGFMSLVGTVLVLLIIVIRNQT